MVFVTTAVTINEYPVPTRSSGPFAITAGPDGKVWFTEDVSSKIGNRMLGGVFEEFALPTSSSSPDGITAGPDSNLWFTELVTTRLGESQPLPVPMAISGSLTVTILTQYQWGEPSRNILLALLHSPRASRRDPRATYGSRIPRRNMIGRITTSGTITLIPFLTGFDEPYGITAGPDGNPVVC